MTVTHDKVVPALKIRHRDSGSYYYHVQNNRWIKIGNTKNIRLKDARHIARDYSAKVAAGIDPAPKDTKPQYMAQVITNWQTYNRLSLKPKTYKNYCGLISKYIQPALGNKKINSITAADCIRLHKSIPAKVQANRVIQLLVKLFNIAIDEGFVQTNPASRVKLNKEQKREAYLTPEQSRRIVKHCQDSDDPRDLYILTLMMTGARESEIRRAKWTDISQSDNELIVDSKTGHRAIHIPDAILQAIMDLYNGSSEYVFPDKAGNNPMPYPQSYWYGFRDRLGLPEDFRLHDFRHNYASVAVSSGVSLDQIGSMLGHSNAQTTKRYSHLVAEKRKDIGEMIASYID